MHLENGQKNKLEIIAYHGWGFGSDFWDTWKEKPPDHITFKTADRGYFFEQKSPRFSSNQHTLKLLFMHSFGLHWCPIQHIQHADFVVIFNGFKTFHPQKKNQHKQSVKKLERMIRQFQKYPREVLQKFWENCFYPDKNKYFNNSDFDKELLLKDLKNLGSVVFDMEGLNNNGSNIQIFSLDGGRDKILGQPMGKLFTELTDQNAVYHFINEAGHALPVTHREDCWSFINAMIPIFVHNEYHREKRK